MSRKSIKLDPKKQSERSLEFENSLRQRVVGQDRAVRAVVKVMQNVTVGFHEAGRTLGNLLFLGPTGSGKTHLVESVAEVLYGNCKAMVKIDCGEFSHGHEIAKLIGSPPGYLGHRETQPLLIQEKLDQYHTESTKITLLLFDEIEKVHPDFTSMLLGILDRAKLTLGDNREVDFQRTIIFMTSNAGVEAIHKAIRGGIGFMLGSSDQQTDKKVYEAAKMALGKQFTPEFLNRIDKTVVFHSLNGDELGQILDFELARVQERVVSSVSSCQFVFSCTPEARAFILKDGIDAEFGARHLRRAIRRHLVNPLSSLVGSAQIQLGDCVLVNYDESEGGMEFILLPTSRTLTAVKENDV